MTEFVSLAGKQSWYFQRSGSHEGVHSLHSNPLLKIRMVDLLNDWLGDCPIDWLIDRLIAKYFLAKSRIRSSCQRQRRHFLLYTYTRQTFAIIQNQIQN